MVSRAIRNEEKNTIRYPFVVNREFGCHDSRLKDHESDIIYFSFSPIEN